MFRKKLKYYVIITAIWTGFLLLSVAQSLKTGLLSNEIDFYLIVWSTGVLLYPIQLYILFKLKESGHRILYILIQLMIGVLIAFVYRHFSIKKIEVDAILLPGIDWQSNSSSGGVLKYISGDTFNIFYLYLIHASIALIWMYNQSIRQKELHEAQLRIKLIKSQIRSLQTELQPHFLFNTLHTVSSLMDEDIEKAQILLEKLADLLRLYLSVVIRLQYKFREELEFLDEYLEIHRIRNNIPILFEKQVTDDCYEFAVPVILLQPLIENSLKHGWIDRREPFTIILSASAKMGRLTIIVRNKSGYKKQYRNEGLGFRNLRERLAALYENDFSIHYDYSEGEFITRIQIPLKIIEPIP